MSLFAKVFDEADDSDYANVTAVERRKTETSLYAAAMCSSDVDEDV